MMRIVSEQELGLTEFVRAGDMVCWGQASAEPTTLVTALINQRYRIGAFGAFVGMTWSQATDPQFADDIAFMSYCAAGTNRLSAAAGRLDILPCHYSRLPSLLKGRVDVLLLQVATPDADGYCSLSCAAEYLADLIPTCRTIVVEINDQAPRTQDGGLLHVDRIACAVRTSRPLVESRRPAVTAAERALAGRVAALVEDEATLQFGLGAVPEAVLDALRGHRDLGVHSGLVGDGLVNLAECGALTNARKGRDAGVTVTGLLTGGRRLADFAHENRAVALRATSYTHDPAVLESLHRFTAINSAIEVDLTGQINAEVAGGRYVGAVGGAVDFLRGAARAPGGLPIVALPSTVVSRGQLSGRIVAALGGPVSTARADAAVIVTEHGVADLRGLTIGERVRAMIEIADPQFRADLDRAAFGIVGRRFHPASG